MIKGTLAQDDLITFNQKYSFITDDSDYVGPYYWIGFKKRTRDQLL